MPKDKDAYVQNVMTAAPEAIVKNAIMIMPDGNGRTSIQVGKNGFTCEIDNQGTPSCALDADSAQPYVMYEHRMLPADMGARIDDRLPLPASTGQAGSSHNRELHRQGGSDG